MYLLVLTYLLTYLQLAWATAYMNGVFFLQSDRLLGRPSSTEHHWWQISLQRHHFASPFTSWAASYIFFSHIYEHSYSPFRRVLSLHLQSLLYSY